MKCFLAILALLVTGMTIMAASRDAQWKKVDDAVKQGLPKTAIDALEPIIKEALAEKAYGDAVKAIGRKIVLEGNIQGNKPEEKIVRMQAEIGKAPKEILPLLETVLADWYWHYFQNNRWRFMQRTAAAETPGADFTTWDLARLFAEIDKHFQKALAPDASGLKKTGVSAYDALLEKGMLPDSYRPTLYDFLAHEALKFYMAGEQTAAKPDDAFEISAESPIFGSVENFLAWKPDTTDTESPKLKAIRLYQDLLRFHQNDPDPSAFVDADIARLVYAQNVSFGENKNARFKDALKAVADKWADHELSALALYHWARTLQQEEDLVEAHNVALRGANAHRDSAGGKLCRNLVSEIEARSANIMTERIWNPPWPTIQVHYRNVTNVYFRAVAYDWNTFLEKRHNRPESLNDQERKELLAKAPTLEWPAKLPPTADFKEHTEELPAPENLKPGFYFLLASYDPNFGDQDNQVTFADIWVSDLALVVRTHVGNIEGFVLEANSGEPLAGAEVATWSLDNQGNRIANPAVKTDENGFFAFAGTQNRGYLLRVRHNGRELGSRQDYHSYQTEDQLRQRPFTQTIFFTDRAIYRPGQIIQYKGICLRVDQEKDNYEVLGGEQLTVVFADPNNKEIARQQYRCNDYGSFSGSFTAPRDRLMGSMRIYVTQGPNGSTHFNVEEYKRPKFQVALDAPKTAAKLNEKVTVQGHALAYTGAAVDGAKVKYRVVREVRWPYWWSWSENWRMRRVSASQEIAHGMATTATDGSFNIEFVAKPDPQVSEKDEVSFSFSFYTDVTDSSGETRSAQRSVNVGFTALKAVVSADDWQIEDKPAGLSITTTTLDGEPQTAEGTVKVYRLKEPDKVHRIYLGESSSYRPSPPLEKPDLSDPTTWELADVAGEKGFTTDAEGKAKLEFKLGVDVYRAMLETQDRFGKKVTVRQPIRVLKPDDTKLAIKIPHLLAAPDWSVEPGTEFTALWGTGYDTGRAFIEIEHRRQMIQRFWTKPGQTQQQIKQAVTEAMRGGFTLHVTQVRENRAYLESRHIDVPWNNKDFEIKWEHFTSKLEPNQKETWTAVIAKRSVGVMERWSDVKTTNRNTPTLQHSNTPEHFVAEMVATLYDQSLDAFMPFHWQQRFSFFRQDHSTANSMFENSTKQFQWIKGQWKQDHVDVQMTYREFPRDLTANVWGYRFALSKGVPLSRALDSGIVAGAGLAAAPPPAPAERTANFFAEADKAKAADLDGRKPPQKGPDLSQVTARKNLNETAFFFPQLISDSNGVVKLQFTMPEALTQWRFLGFAHDKQCRSGFLEDKTVTAKDLMVQPNPPRFLREGDVLELSVKVSNQTAARQEGKVKLSFNYALNGEPADAALELHAVESRAGVSPAQTGPKTKAGQAGRPPYSEIDFDIPAKESRSYSWRIKVPDGCGFLTFKAVGSTGKVSDGEEGYLPVLSRRIFVTESLPLPIRGPATKKFEFAKLIKSGKSDTLRHQNLTIQMVSNPSWYAVMALPYLMEFPHECTEQTFNRLYANALARSIANSDPKIRKIFDQWKNTPALDSPLEKNQDLKSVMLEETPWLRQAQSESHARKDVGILFDENRLNYETGVTLQKLAEAQLPDGEWPWFPGGRGNDYITLYITTGFGRLRHLGVDIDIAPAVRSLNRLDQWMTEQYERIQKSPNPGEYVPSATDALYLYGRSFFLKDKSIAAPHKQANDFFLAQSRKHWLKLANRQSQGHLALALQRFNASTGFNDSTPRDIMRSIKERSVSDEEMGLFWRETELSWWWYRAPIETQALMIEAFDEVMGDAKAVEDCKVWLLKQKQTQDWKTTKATADAVYALLLRGRDFLASDNLVEVALGGKIVTPSPSPQPSPSGRGSREAPRGEKAGVPQRTRAVDGSPSPRGEGRGEGNRGGELTPRVEPGTGFYEVRFASADIKPKLGEITVKKVDPGVAWGSVHWQYLEDMTKVTPYAGTPLKLKKMLYTKQTTKKSPVLEPMKGALSVGDELVVRIELRVDRDMEYVHMKDQRGSGTEPVNVISRYKYQDGLGYYESTRDTASHFFIDYLPKGVYVFEYSTRVVHKGQYQTGIAEIQCMYAPEFNSHSESHALTVQ